MTIRSFLIRISAAMTLLLTFIAVSDTIVAQKKKKKAPTKIENVSAEKRKNEQSMRNTSAQIEAKKAEIGLQLSRLNTLNAEIDANRTALGRLAIEADSISKLSAATSDSLSVLTIQAEKLRAAYIESLRRLQPYDRNRSTLSFIFTSKDFVTLQRRLRYLKQFSTWRQQRSEALMLTLDSLEAKRNRLAMLESKSNALITQANNEQLRLDSNRKGAEEIVQSLRRDEQSLRQVLEQQKRQARILDQKLDKLIAEEQARIAREKEKEAERRRREAADKKGTDKKTPGSATTTPPPSTKPSPAPAAMTESSSVEIVGGSFADNKGKLPFPVAGKYRVISKFGRQPHPSLPKVEIENSGIDIETSPGAAARAVFDGKVSAIFKEDGYNSIVMVRHGSYITIYAGIDNVNVKTGDKVKAGQTIGKVNVDASRGIPVLHFEIRNERNKLNPSAWLGK